MLYITSECVLIESALMILVGTCNFPKKCHNFIQFWITKNLKNLRLVFTYILKASPLIYPDFKVENVKHPSTLLLNFTKMLVRDKMNLL